MIRVSYHTVNGQIRNANIQGSAKIDMFRDRLGSVVQTVAYTNSPALSQRFLPYGTLQSSTPTSQQPASDMRMGWAGRWGYRRTSMTNAERYVRARHYSSIAGRWVTRDPLWPGPTVKQSNILQISPFGYTGGHPNKYIDPSGLAPCPGSVKSVVSQMGGELATLAVHQDMIYKVKCCIEETARRRSTVCSQFNQTIADCIWDNFPRVECAYGDPSNPSSYPSGCRDPKSGGLDIFGFTPPATGNPHFVLCWTNTLLDRRGTNYLPSLQKSFKQTLWVTILHETLHTCGFNHGLDKVVRRRSKNKDTEPPPERTCNEIAVCCIYQVLNNWDWGDCVRNVPKR